MSWKSGVVRIGKDFVSGRPQVTAGPVVCDPLGEQRALRQPQSTQGRAETRIRAARGPKLIEATVYPLQTGLPGA